MDQREPTLVSSLASDDNTPMNENTTSEINKVNKDIQQEVIVDD